MWGSWVQMLTTLLTAHWYNFLQWPICIILTPRCKVCNIVRIVCMLPSACGCKCCFPCRSSTLLRSWCGNHSRSDQCAVAGYHTCSTNQWYIHQCTNQVSCLMTGPTCDNWSCPHLHTLELELHCNSYELLLATLCPLWIRHVAVTLSIFQSPRG